MFEAFFLLRSEFFFWLRNEASRARNKESTTISVSRAIKYENLFRNRTRNHLSRVRLLWVTLEYPARRREKVSFGFSGEKGNRTAHKFLTFYKYFFAFALNDL